MHLFILYVQIRNTLSKAVNIWIIISILNLIFNFFPIGIDLLFLAAGIALFLFQLIYDHKARKLRDAVGFNGIIGEITDEQVEALQKEAANKLGITKEMFQEMQAEK
jgi:uncharacterized protein YqfA (UPF0365 family)